MRKSAICIAQIVGYLISRSLEIILFIFCSLTHLSQMHTVWLISACSTFLGKIKIQSRDSFTDKSNGMEYGEPIKHQQKSSITFFVSPNNEKLTIMNANNTTVLTYYDSFENEFQLIEIPSREKKLICSWFSRRWQQQQQQPLCAMTYHFHLN